MWNAFKMDYELKIVARDYREVEGYREQVKEFLKIFLSLAKVNATGVGATNRTKG